MELFGRMANPSQDKIALDFPELRIQAVKQQLLQLLTDSFFNNHSFSPQHQPDISSWYPSSNYDVSHPHERRTWIWIAQKLQFIKTGMTTLMANFSSSGNLSNDADDHTRDLKFFQDFSRQQPLWFWIYMCWDHGRNIPSWNTSLLPDDQRLDIGTDNVDDADGDDLQQEKRPNSQVSSVSAKKKKTIATVATSGSVQEDALTSLIQVSNHQTSHTLSLNPNPHNLTHIHQVSHHLMTQHISSQGTSNSSNSEENQRSDRMRQLLEDTKSMQEALKVFPECFHADLRSQIEKSGEEYLRVVRMTA